MRLYERNKAFICIYRQSYLQIELVFVLNFLAHPRILFLRGLIPHFVVFKQIIARSVIESVTLRHIQEFILLVS